MRLKRFVKGVASDRLHFLSSKFGMSPVGQAFLNFKRIKMVKTSWGSISCGQNRDSVTN